MNDRVVQPSAAQLVRKLMLLLCAAAAMWLLMAWPAHRLAGSLGLEGLTYAGLLCLAPGWLVVYVTSRYPEAGSPSSAVLLGTGLRMAFVLIGMVGIRSVRPDLGHNEFQLWLVLYYLAFLAVETVMVVKSINKQKS